MVESNHLAYLLLAVRDPRGCVIELKGLLFHTLFVEDRFTLAAGELQICTIVPHVGIKTLHHIFTFTLLLTKQCSCNFVYDLTDSDTRSPKNSQGVFL